MLFWLEWHLESVRPLASASLQSDVLLIALPAPVAALLPLQCVVQLEEDAAAAVAVCRWRVEGTDASVVCA